MPDLAYQKAVTAPNEAVISDQVIDELKRIFDRKFPHRRTSLDTFLESLFSTVTIIATPDKEERSERAIRDVKDRPILRAAINADIDIFITGDKDFLESGLKEPRIMTAAEFYGRS